MNALSTRCAVWASSRSRKGSMPRRLLRDGEVVSDEWRTASEAAPGDDVLLTFVEWSAEREQWLARPGSSRAGRLGVILSPSDAVEILAHDLPHLGLVGAEFPGPSEGRGYSQGRLLRERFGFAGELRACGRIGRDHVFLLARCGFNDCRSAGSRGSAARGPLPPACRISQPRAPACAAGGARAIR